MIASSACGNELSCYTKGQGTLDQQSNCKIVFLRLLHGIIYLAHKIINIQLNIGLLLNFVQLSNVFTRDIVNLDVML
jgi:hypothetical protein